jgi:hypothetical protein
MSKPIRNISEGRFKRRIINRYPVVNETPPVKEEPQNAIKNVHTDRKEFVNMSKNTQEYFKHLEDTNVKGYDDQLPFFYNHPPVQGIFDLSTLARGKNEEVLRAYDGLRLGKIEKEYDIVTVLPFRGRWLHLEKTLATLLISAKNNNSRIGFLIIENSKASIFNKSKFSDEPDVHYHWINSHSNIFNKCVCHNIGAALTKSKFIHFHDCDLPVPVNFYEALINELNVNPAVQAFNGRRVNYLKEDTTKLYFDGLSIDKISRDPSNYKEGVPGAPGGSIALSRELFLRVGGFDPHFFWAYSIEDRFFWEKVEKYNHITTLENPKIELYHLWHPPGWGKNPYERFEQRIYQLFSSDAHGWQNYINTSVELYNLLVEKFIEP